MDWEDTEDEEIVEDIHDCRETGSTYQTKPDPVNLAVICMLCSRGKRNLKAQTRQLVCRRQALVDSLLDVSGLMWKAASCLVFDEVEFHDEVLVEVESLQCLL